MKKKLRRERLVARVCQNPKCGKDFEAAASKVKIGKGLYCTTKCCIVHRSLIRHKRSIRPGASPWGAPDEVDNAHQPARSE